MDSTVCDRLKTMLATLDRISNTILMAREPPKGYGISIFHIYIAPGNRTHADQKIVHFMYVEKHTNPTSGRSFFTCPNTKIEWQEGITRPELPNTVWIDLALGDEDFKYDSYAALHILTDLTPPSLPDTLPHNATMQWEGVRVLRPLAEDKSSQIGRTIGGFLNQKIFPFMLNNDAYTPLLQ
jgi:hypothetical protein